MVRCGAGGIAGILPAIPLPVAPHRVDQKEGGVAAAPIAPMRRHAPAHDQQEERLARRALAHERACAPIAHGQAPSAHLHRGAAPAAALSQLSGRVARAAWRRLRRASGGGRSSSTRLQVVRSGRCVHRSTVSSCPSPSPRSSCARRPAASNAAPPAHLEPCGRPFRPRLCRTGDGLGRECRGQAQWQRPAGALPARHQGRQMHEELL